jgi:hypothetical protein
VFSPSSAPGKAPKDVANKFNSNRNKIGGIGPWAAPGVELHQAPPLSIAMPAPVGFDGRRHSTTAVKQELT